jgi:tRNA (cmo5U34)-methyltransferase
MTQRSIGAYDLPGRVASYDADMDLMHPNRPRMIQAGLDILPFPESSSLVALDLGVGTGYFTERFLRRFQNGRVVAVDGAAAMIDLARARLGMSADRADFRVGDFRQLQRLGLGVGWIDVVFSSYALHHLTRDDKQRVVSRVVALLRPGGWFINADLVIADTPELESRIQQLRVAGIVSRAGGRDPRFADAASTRRLLDDLEANEGDQPLTVSEDLQILRGAGFRASVLWLEHREAVCAGVK